AREGADQEIAPNAITEVPRHCRQVRGLSRAKAVAVGVHEIDQHDLPFDQIIVEADRLILVSSQNRVREVARPRPGAGSRLTPEPDSPKNHGSQRGQSPTYKQSSSSHG